MSAMAITELEPANITDDLRYVASTRRPAGVGAVVQHIYELLAEQPQGLTRDEIYRSVREGWLATDVYRKYEQRRTRKSPEYGSPAFKERAQRWYVGERLRSMLKSRFARTDGERYFVGARLPKVAVICPARRRHLVALDANARDAHRRENEEFVRREHAKSELMKVLNDRALSRGNRKSIQLALNYLSGRTIKE